MKKIIAPLLSIVLLTSLIPAAYAAQAGDVVGKIYSTDILAYVDGVPIPSYNIGGKTVISENDLPDYGFDVTWNEADRLLIIQADEFPQTAPTPSVSRGKVGKILGNVYYTDIKVVVNGIYVDAYNIGGVTMIAIEDLGGNEPISNPNEAIGYTINGFRYTWSATNRTICMNVLRKNSVIRIDGADYTVTGLCDYTAATGDYLKLVGVSQDTDTILADWGYMLRTNPNRHSQKMFETIFGDGWQLSGGKLTITVEQDTKKVTMSGITDENRDEYVGCCALGYYASNAISPATIPIVSVPTQITNEGKTQDLTLDGYIYSGEMLFDAETILKSAGILV